jgi:signal transduction histidine kinase
MLKKLVHQSKQKTTYMTDENLRLEVLRQYDILDTHPESEFDNITFLASTLCNTPISTITLIDQYRQWFKSKIGLDNTESPREYSFCSLAIEKSSETVVVERLMEDEDFRKIGLLNGLTDSGFYAGVPIKDKSSGLTLGTLCVIDYVNKTLTEQQIKSLEILAEQTSKLFELRRRFKSLSDNNETLHLKYSELEKFAGVISHDIKSPLNSIISLIGLIKENSETAFKEEDFEYLSMIEECSFQLKNYIDGVLNYYKLDGMDLSVKNEIAVDDLIDEIRSMLNLNSKVSISYHTEYSSLVISKYGLIQILMNLVGNGIKYNDKENVEIIIRFEESSDDYIIKVSDNGIGMKSEHFEEIYQSFKNLNIKDRFGNYGTGMGLSTVKKIVDKLNGRIGIESELTKGTTFTVRLKK